MADKKIIIETKKLTKDFGSLRAVNEVDWQVEVGAIRAIIGPNGAGKSTFLDLVTNRTHCTSGEVFFQGENITNKPVHYIAEKGMGKCFQISKLFPTMTVFENVQIAAINRAGLTYNLFRPSRKLLQDEVDAVLDSIGILDKSREQAQYLSYGDQRRLEIGITLAMEPKVLLLDEPTAGIARSEGYAVMDLVQRLAQERHLTIVFIEHDMDIVFNYSESISVMDHGRMIATGTPQEIRENPEVQESYLGGMK
jgi:branched-chain amino acid transport system ATP-binding protein